MFIWSDISSDSIERIVKLIHSAYHLGDEGAKEMTEAATKTAQSDKAPNTEKKIENNPVVHIDVFNPVLKTAVQPYAMSAEQDMYIKAILEKACSDNQFAEKAYQAIKLLLTGNGLPEQETTTTKSMK